jgi:hypothetical protein
MFADMVLLLVGGTALVLPNLRCRPGAVPRVARGYMYIPPLTFKTSPVT